MVNKRLVILIIISSLVAYFGIYLAAEIESSKMSYSTWKSANSALDLIGKNVLVVGGTQGIGAGVAIRFSQLGSSVAIAGRNEILAKEVISKMQASNKSESQEFRFFKVDATLLADLERFSEVIYLPNLFSPHVKEIKQYYEARGGVDYIVQTQGVLNSALSLTAEGHDKAFMINSYSKWYITNKLLPLLKVSNIWICNPATRGSINFDDVELNTSFRFPGNNQKVITSNSYERWAWK
jgi:NAD(P)-dependent dehydrogenase (short-subunit alcohol dehydrogenase family)